MWLMIVQVLFFVHCNGIYGSSVWQPHMVDVWVSILMDAYAEMMNMNVFLLLGRAP